MNKNLIWRRGVAQAKGAVIKKPSDKQKSLFENSIKYNAVNKSVKDKRDKKKKESGENYHLKRWNNIIETPFNTEFEIEMRTIFKDEYNTVTMPVIANRKYAQLDQSLLQVSNKLSDKSIRMMLYIMNILEYESNYFVMRYEDYCQHWHQTSRDVYTEAIKELIKIEFIARKRGKRNTFYINHFMFFKGDLRGALTFHNKQFKKS